MTLSFHDIGLRWPDAVVLWDRDVAPTLDWEPRFVERDGQLWAELAPSGQPCRGAFGMASRTICRCLAWDESEWITHVEFDRRRHIAWLDEDLRSGRVKWPDHEWRREYLGQWIDEAQHFDNDTIRAIAYGAERMWRMGHSALDEYREIARGRWPTLRRVLGRNQPR